MKLNPTNILLGCLVGLLIWQNFFSKSKEEEPTPITITIPEREGSSGERVIERVVTQPVYISQTDETIDVDSEWKKRYEQTQDSLEKTKLYLEAIKIQKYEKTLVDNDTIQIKGYATTRGSLLDYRVDYTIKPSDFTYTPEYITKRPKFSMVLGVDAGVPSTPDTNFLLKGRVGFENSKGNGISLGYDTQQRFYIGLHKNITILK